ncbi:HWE histidine kinase domain-containing protein [Rhizobium rhizoryzae]|uniref:HWE histidine kinase domain-containing protein n=1 Tax=Rhizobium rhizoryzae TaxID=451876 RepID=UPI00289D0A09|nr:HWE histidine kinase domain-containing protein [Rhizobium rhizoryzae]
MEEISSSAWDETARSGALHSYNVLDTPPEQDFDDIAKVAARVCGAPIAVVNLVDTRRQFFKAEVGLGVRSTPLETAFCRHALLEDDVLVIPDATRDHRLECNPLVTGEPHIRSYAGALLKTEDGLPIGTVCVLDYAVRDFSDDQVEMLRFLARQAMTQLELRRTVTSQRQLLARTRAAERAKANFERVVRQASDFIGIADRHGKVIFLNDAARELVGLEQDEPLPPDVLDYVAEADHQVFKERVVPAVKSGESCEQQIRLTHFRTGEIVPALYTMFPMRDEDGETVGYGVVTKDMTELKAEDARRAGMMAEAAHRIKNTLSIVQAIVSQSLRNAGNIEEAKDVISKRVMALAKAQDILTTAEGAIADIVDVVSSALAPHDSGLGRFHMQGPSRNLDPRQALGLSLALHELATNAAKYGALSGEQGKVEIDWTVHDDGTFAFQWAESGGPPVFPPTRTGFGSQLINRMVAPYFKGAANVEYHPSGIRFSLKGQLSRELS